MSDRNNTSIHSDILVSEQVSIQSNAYICFYKPQIVHV
jgi:hypothetical protein